MRGWEDCLSLLQQGDYWGIFPGYEPKLFRDRLLGCFVLPEQSHLLLRFLCGVASILDELKTFKRVSGQVNPLLGVIKLNFVRLVVDFWCGGGSLALLLRLAASSPF